MILIIFKGMCCCLINSFVLLCYILFIFLIGLGKVVIWCMFLVIVVICFFVKCKWFCIVLEILWVVVCFKFNVFVCKMWGVLVLMAVVILFNKVFF